jgi:hypothetical protein
MVTTAAPAQTTTNTPVNTIADWFAGAVILSMLEKGKTTVSVTRLFVAVSEAAEGCMYIERDRQSISGPQRSP